MTVKQNQGFLRDLNLQEIESVASAINVLGGEGISDDLLILKNNLRNISTTAYISLLDGFFFFGSNNDFVFTNDDIITVSKDVNVGSTILTSGTNYYVCNSDAKTKFKLSSTSSNVGINTITVISVSPTDFNFIRKDPVHQENIINFIKPEIQDTTNFNYLGNLSINNAIESLESSVQTVDDLISKKYKKSSDTTAVTDINVDGVITISDPTGFNVSDFSLLNANSPGLFIGTTRAFSSDDNLWSKVGTALSTSSSSVSIGELYFNDTITITGISTESATEIAITSFTHKIPILINNETYYILLGT